MNPRSINTNRVYTRGGGAKVEPMICPRCKSQMQSTTERDYQWACRCGLKAYTACQISETVHAKWRPKHEPVCTS